MYIPRNWEFGSALAKLRKWGGGLNPPNPPFGIPLHSCITRVQNIRVGCVVNIVVWYFKVSLRGKVSFACEQNVNLVLWEGLDFVLCWEYLTLTLLMSYIQGDSLARGRKYWRNAFKCTWIWKQTIISIDYQHVQFCTVPVCVYTLSSYYLNNIICIDNSLVPLARDSPCIWSFL
jgi:hypothetical protein